VGEIAGWRGEGCSMAGLLFAAEDFCASTGIVRSKSRIELLHARSRLILAAKAFQVPAIDMVCINFKDDAVLKEECEEGRRLGFDGKVGRRVSMLLQRYRADLLPSIPSV
jgi:citrate lyase subunit beta-like protein